MLKENEAIAAMTAFKGGYTHAVIEKSSVTEEGYIDGHDKCLCLYENVLGGATYEFGKSDARGLSAAERKRVKELLKKSRKRG